jgi:hypothetical protein
LSRLLLDQLCDGGARNVDAALQSLPLGAQRVEKFRQLDHRDRERDWITGCVTAKI